MAQEAFSLEARINLRDDHSMPRIHLGVYEVSGDDTGNAIQWALDAGYRGIDCAQCYYNEREVGTAINSWLSQNPSVTRKDIHYTTKLETNVSYEDTRKSIRESLEKCGLGYIDLFLLHSPYGGKTARLECWKAVEDAIDEGIVKIGGVSNFGVKHLQELLDSHPRTIPAVNQVEVHPFLTRTDITTFCHQHDIVIEAYCPLVKAQRMDHPTIVSLARKYSRSPAQILLRWSLQHGYIPLPKSVTKERIIANGEVGGFEIGGEDMGVLDGLDEYLVMDWDPTGCE